MHSISIKAKVVLVIACCLLVGALVLIRLVQQSYSKDVNLVASQALRTAQKSYRNLEENDYRALAMTCSALQLDDRMRSLYAKRDRAGLIHYLTPLCKDYSTNYGISLLSFIEPDRTMFLRMLQPKKFGDPIKMQVLENSIKSQSLVYGSELGKAGYALRCVTPYYDQTHQLIGYFLLGDTYDSFLSTMKKEMHDDYTMVGLKTLCDEKNYRSGQVQKGLKDTWDAYPNIVVLSATNNTSNLGNVTKELANIPEEGKLLGAEKIGNHVVVRGVFPLVDLAGKRIGGVFVMHDITMLYNGLKTVETSAVITIILLMLVISIIITLILKRLVFDRLQHTMDVATRMVGGDFDTQIVPASNDEVGQLETLLEQFRGVFVNTVREMEEESRKTKV